MTKTVIIFFLIMAVVMGGWIALVELVGIHVFLAGLISIGVAYGMFYLYQKYK